MYSMPQQAVTKGYWNMENLRAQPSVSESALSKKPMLSSRRVTRTGTLFSSPRSGATQERFPPASPPEGGTGCRSRIELQRALAPDVQQADRKRHHEGEHLEVGEPAQAFAVQVAQQRAPRVDEHALDVEDDEEQRNQVEFDRMARMRVAEGGRAALERGLLDPGDPARPEHGREHADGKAEHARDQEQHQDRNVGREVVHRQGGGK